MGAAPAADDPEAPDDAEAADDPDDPEALEALEEPGALAEPGAPNEPGNPLALTPNVPRAETRCPASCTEMAGGAPAGASMAMTTRSSARAEEPGASRPCVQAAPLETRVQVQPPGPVGARLSRPVGPPLARPREPTAR